MQEKYRKDYVKALKTFRIARKELLVGLEHISYLKVFPTQANYVLCEVTERYTGREIAEKLLQNNILIKDLTGEISDGKQYIRLAVREIKDNERLILQLKRLDDTKE